MKGADAEPTRRVGIYVFDEVEVLDFAGPFEVFSTAARVARRLRPRAAAPFEVFTVGARRAAVTARGGLRVEPAFAMGRHPGIDVLVIPGGVVEDQAARREVIEWIGAQASCAEVCASVCTGAFLLARAGLLAGRRATTHWEDLDGLRALAAETRVVTKPRWVDEGRIVTSAGISAGIDMSLHLVGRLAGEDLALRTARQMDYRWRGGRPRGARGPA